MITTVVDGVTLSGRPPAADLLAAHGDKLVWVDAVEVDAAELDWLAEAFSLHPLEVDDIRGRNERPKVDDYGRHLFVVLIGAVRDPVNGHLQLAEVHVAVGAGYVLTVRDRTLPALDALRNRCSSRPELAMGAAGSLFYRICDAVIDSYFPLLDELDEEIDALETSIIERADSAAVREIFGLKRDLNILRRVLGPQRDLMQGLAGPHGPQLGDETKLYLRDVYDHSVRITEQVDAYRDIVTGALDVYLSSVNNRLGEQTRRLTLVATIFLPLTFFTGFFGQNFGAEVGFIQNPWTFWAGLALMLSSIPTIYLVSQRLARGARPLPDDVERRRSLALTARLAPRRDPHHDLELRPISATPERRPRTSLRPSTGGGADALEKVDG